MGPSGVRAGVAAARITVGVGPSIDRRGGAVNGTNTIVSNGIVDPSRPPAVVLGVTRSRRHHGPMIAIMTTHAN
jgi:hypothetical protein